jgi:hypothetical protein
MNVLSVTIANDLSNISNKLSFDAANSWPLSFWLPDWFYVQLADLINKSLTFGGYAGNRWWETVFRTGTEYGRYYLIMVLSALIEVLVLVFSSRNLNYKEILVANMSINQRQQYHTVDTGLELSGDSVIVPNLAGILINSWTMMRSC